MQIDTTPVRLNAANIGLQDLILGFCIFGGRGGTQETTVTSNSQPEVQLKVDSQEKVIREVV
jgi:hypothetical protein